MMNQKDVRAYHFFNKALRKLLNKKGILTEAECNDRTFKKINTYKASDVESDSGISFSTQDSALMNKLTTQQKQYLLNLTQALS